jgi:hypothetical protein
MQMKKKAYPTKVKHAHYTLDFILLQTDALSITLGFTSNILISHTPISQTVFLRQYKIK